jgi:hypothetical protein
MTLPYHSYSPTDAWHPYITVSCTSLFGEFACRSLVPATTYYVGGVISTLSSLISNLCVYHIVMPNLNARLQEIQDLSSYIFIFSHLLTTPAVCGGAILLGVSLTLPTVCVLTIVNITAAWLGISASQLVLPSIKETQNTSSSHPPAFTSDEESCSDEDEFSPPSFEFDSSMSPFDTKPPTLKASPDYTRELIMSRKTPPQKPDSAFKDLYANPLPSLDQKLKKGARAKPGMFRSHSLAGISLNQ